LGVCLGSDSNSSCRNFVSACGGCITFAGGGTGLGHSSGARAAHPDTASANVSQHASPSPFCNLGTLHLVFVRNRGNLARLPAFLLRSLGSGLLHRFGVVCPKLRDLHAPMAAAETVAEHKRATEQQRRSAPLGR
jgi:hypothetical protein